MTPFKTHDQYSIVALELWLDHIDNSGAWKAFMVYNGPLQCLTNIGHWLGNGAAIPNTK